MKKLLLSTLALLPLALTAPRAQAQDYSYDCLCLYSDPRGTCREYTCDAYQTRRRSYYNYNNNRVCDGRYGTNCGYNDTYRPRYWNSSDSYYDSRYDYDWYYRRYTTQPNYYNYPNYNDRQYGYPYYY
ncbi:hypothetical protein AUJ46_02080 [Candidatus Peregrinibacteria bacterium CG1_02_54_53]|nr:MAG: hypothetical protein AUJ46_02080 [Candidatus Peregrinibacteria bacterium CG1_02_54_53]